MRGTAAAHCAGGCARRDRRAGALRWGGARGDHRAGVGSQSVAPSSVADTGYRVVLTLHPPLSLLLRKRKAGCHRQRTAGHPPLPVLYPSPSRPAFELHTVRPPRAFSCFREAASAPPVAALYPAPPWPGVPGACGGACKERMEPREEDARAPTAGGEPPPATGGGVSSAAESAGGETSPAAPAAAVPTASAATAPSPLHRLGLRRRHWGGGPSSPPSSGSGGTPAGGGGSLPAAVPALAGALSPLPLATRAPPSPRHRQ